MCLLKIQYRMHVNTNCSQGATDQASMYIHFFCSSFCEQGPPFLISLLFKNLTHLTNLAPSGWCIFPASDYKKSLLQHQPTDYSSECAILCAAIIERMKALKK